MKRDNILHFICNIYIAVWLLYNFHWMGVGILFPFFESISNLLLALNLVISVFFSAIVWTDYRQNTFFRYTNFLLFLFVFYGLFSVLESPRVAVAQGGYIKSGTYMVAALRSFLPLYTFFFFSLKGCVTEKTMKIWFWVYLAQTILIYFASRQLMGLLSSDEMLTNNVGYMFTELFPFVFFFRKSVIIQILIAFSFWALTFISIKRGAILVCSLAAIYMLQNQYKHVSTAKKSIITGIVVAMFFIGTAWVEHLYSSSTVLQHRVEKTLEGNSSGRDHIASFLLDQYFSSDILHLLFGYGADGTLRVIKYAHNDWLELLYNQGIIGFIAYFAFWLTWYKLWRNERRNKTEIAYLLGLLFICSFPKTLFSMWYSMANLFTTMPLGFCIAKIVRRRAVSNNVQNVISI